MERNQLIQHMNQLETKTQHNVLTLEITQLILSTSKKVQPKQVERSELSSPTPIIILFITERQKEHFFTNAISFTENPIYNSANSRPIEKHCIETYSIPLIREQHDSCFYIFYKTFESNYADVLFTVVFNPVKNLNTGIVLQTKDPRGILLPLHDVVEHFLNKLQEANDFLKQPIVVLSADDGLRNKEQFFETSEVDKIK